uniref:GNAT family N-acetyltransferase n=1 Tax=Globicatella sulfidifaciens TaxID=136093 RepID=UPI0023EFEC3E|nr:GNAT family N-acetyltransferase [Globicatella sulfidifaciens]
MIRAFKLEDLDQVMQIWLESNLEAHHFINCEYWIANAPMVKEQLLDAEIYVYEYENKIVGFVGLQDNYLAGIFVDKSMRSIGIGKQLLDYAKELREELLLTVYHENESAVKFYTREGLTIISQEMDEVTNNLELLMQYKA